MKAVQRKHIQELKTTSSNITQPRMPFDFYKGRGTESFLTKVHLDAIQSDLKQLYGYQISQKTLYHLPIYCEYYKLLKETIATKDQDRKKKGSFLEQFSRSHSQDHFTKLFIDMQNIGSILKKNTVQYGRQCLIKYFGLDEFRQDKLVSLLIKKINQAKTSRLIDFQEVKAKKNKKSFASFDQKQNKFKNSQYYDNCQSKKNITQKQSKVYFQILTLKMILKETNPNPLETNKLCESIKNDLETLFKCLKLKICIKEVPLKKKRFLLKQQ